MQLHKTSEALSENHGGVELPPQAENPAERELLALSDDEDENLEGTELHSENAKAVAIEAAYRPAFDDVAPEIQEIINEWRLRTDILNAWKRLTLQMKAICRRFCAGDKGEANVLYKAVTAGKGGKHQHEKAGYAALALAPLLAARTALEPDLDAREKRLRTLAEALPVSGWVRSIDGAGMLGLAAIVGEAGDLSGYDRPPKLWKRLGLAVIDGRAQHKVKDVEQALIQGYNPRRRSVSWTISDSLFKAQSARVDEDTGEVKRPAGFYRRLYDSRKTFEQANHPKLIKKVIHRRALRYMEKRFIMHLWAVWNHLSGANEVLLEPDSGLDLKTVECLNSRVSVKA